jgi:hypothetical protein
LRLELLNVCANRSGVPASGQIDGGRAAGEVASHEAHQLWLVQSPLFGVGRERKVGRRPKKSRLRRFGGWRVVAALKLKDFEEVTDDAFSFLSTDHGYTACAAERGGHLGSGFLRRECIT